MNFDKTSIIITLFVLIVLVMASPTQAAISVDVGTLPNVTLGDKFDFDIVIDDISPFVIILDNGTHNITCEFDRHGNNLKKTHSNGEDVPDECRGVKIMKPGHEYGYGYGYGHGGEYKYQVRIETNKGFIKTHGAGFYNITLQAGEDSYSFDLEVLEPAGNGNSGKGNSAGNGNAGAGNSAGNGNAGAGNSAGNGNAGAGNSAGNGNAGAGNSAGNGNAGAGNGKGKN